MPEPNELLVSTSLNSPVMKALVATSPVSANDEVEVIIPSFDLDQRWGPCRFEAHTQNDGSLRLPVRMDECLVSFDEEQEIQLVAWWHDDPTSVADRVSDARVDALETLVPQFITAVGQPTFQNSWVNHDAGSPSLALRSAYYMDEGNGFWKLGGVIKTGASDTTAFTLPLGARPVANEIHLVNAGAVAVMGTVDTITDGRVIPRSGTGNVSTWCFLGQVRFYVG